MTGFQKGLFFKNLLKWLYIYIRIILLVLERKAKVVILDKNQLEGKQTEGHQKEDNTHNFVKTDPKFKNKALFLFLQNFMESDMTKILDPQAVGKI